LPESLPICREERTDSPDGPQLLVFESPKGAWNGDPEVFSLPAPATAATLGDHDRDTRADIAIVAGSELVLIRGRDRRLSEGARRMAAVPSAKVESATLPFDAGSIAFGDFTGRGIGELAVFSASGTLKLIGAQPPGISMSGCTSPTPTSQISIST
jgi:hypothetical protein